MSRAKVIIFIVEGISDKEALNGILSELYDEKRFVFSIVDGDITTQNSSKVDTIRAKIGDYINKAAQRDKFLKTDVERVVHLIDTDGIYIPDKNIIINHTINILYTENNIETDNVNSIIARNEKKRSILNILSTMPAIYKGKNSIPYYMFYMSCNLEHVLHNVQNAIKEEKVNLAEKLEDKYIDNPHEFIKFMSESDFTVPGAYKDTWDFIKQDLNSLHRYSNFHLFFNMDKEEEF
ncbi:hypothetical protein ACJDU8_16735 [Clostridium sp. WILCCON 0269]|uniref:Uncharacterized protein n=1 Tax=Candidatus Clostridium eludens TaxID=3381663 RepID=A0ABW8SRB6_9CLOT